MEPEQLQKAAAAATAAVVVGAIGPWATAFGISKAGVEGDGVITLIGAALALAAIWFGRNLAALILSALVGLILVVDLIDVLGEDLVGAGWGLYLSIVGAALLIYASAALWRQPPV